MSTEEIEVDDIQAAVAAALEEDAIPEVIESDVNIEKPAEDLQEEPEFTEKELEAKDHGWNPEGQDRDGNTLTAEEYLARKPLFNKIHNLQDKLDAYDERYKNVESKVGKLVEQNQQIAAAKIAERETLLEQLKTAKENALTNLDVEQVRAIDDKMESVREDLAKTSQITETVTDQPAETEAYKAFVAENEWAKDTTSPLHKIAIDIGEGFVERNIKAGIKITEADVYKYAAEQVKDLYPHKFGEAVVKQPRVGNNNQRQPIKPVVTKKTLNDIPEDQRAIAKEVMESTGMKEDEYVAMYY